MASLHLKAVPFLLLMVSPSPLFAQSEPLPSGAAIYPTDGAHTYRPELADQFQWSRLEDSIPADAAAREIWAKNLAYDATIYGTVPVLTYRQMFDQAVDKHSSGYVGFNLFAHGRELAGPGYKPFKSPNADTLYSNAYLDLRDGPVFFDVPDTSGRYFTANFLDMFGNASNISARTHGMKGGRYLIATGDWQGEVPQGVQLFRVTSPFMWILLRVLVHNPADALKANKLQDRFILTPSRLPSAHAAFPDGRDQSAGGFLRILDFMLRENGHPEREQGFVHNLRGIGIAGPSKIDEVLSDAPSRAGVEQGYRDAQQVINASIAQNGRRIGHWSEPLDIGRFGFNYLYRATVNTLGTGANVTDENYPFTTFEDAQGQRLDGNKGVYELRLSPPPPVRYFWSVTVYDLATRALYPNSENKYIVNDRTPGLIWGKDGSVSIRFQSAPVKGKAKANWIPVPNGPFYVSIRAQGPKEAILNQSWRPSAIERIGDTRPATTNK